MIDVDKSVKTLLCTDCQPCFCQVIEIFLNGSSYLVLSQYQYQSGESHIKLFNTITSCITTLCLTEYHRIRGIVFHEETKSLYFSDPNHDTICRDWICNPFVTSIRWLPNECNGEINCGTHNVNGLRDGVGCDALFRTPNGIGFSTVDKNILFVCDAVNSSIRKVDILTKQVTTVTTSIKTQFPESIHVDRYDNLFVYDRIAHSILKVNKQGISKTIFTHQMCNREPSTFLTLDDKRNVIFHCGRSVFKVTFPEAQLFRFQLSTLHRWNRLFSSSSFSSQDNKKVLLFLLCMEILGGVDHHQRENKKKKGKIESIIRHAQDRTTLKKQMEEQRKEMPFLKYVFSSFVS